MHKTIIKLISLILGMAFITNFCHAFDLYKETEDTAYTKPEDVTNNKTEPTANYAPGIENNNINKQNKNYKQDKIRTLRKEERKQRQNKKHKKYAISKNKERKKR